MQGSPGVPYVFISYASADRERALAVVAALRQAGIAVWIDQSGIPGGALYGEEIAAGIEHAAAMILMCTPASLASRNVRQEILLGWKFQKSYLPLLLEPCEFPKEMAYWLEGSQWVEILDTPEALWLPQALAALERMGIGRTPGDSVIASSSPDASAITPAISAIVVTMPEPPPLFGREREQAMLRERLTDALGGQGGLVLIGGEAGVGKTALTESLTYEATMQGALVLVGRCYDLTETPPYGPWTEIRDRVPVAPDLPPLPSAATSTAASQAEFFREALAFFVAVAARQPVVLILDDMQWADPASLDLLRFLARSVASLPILLVATYRAEDVTRRHPLYALLPILLREASATRLDLHRLPIADVTTLVADRYRLPEAEATRLVVYLHERAGGNVFFTMELLRALEEEGVLREEPEGWAVGDLAAVQVPLLLRQVIDTRLARLGEKAERLLGTAAVIGQTVPLALWQTVAETDEDALLDLIERAGEARVLEETTEGEGVRFLHALTRQALYEGIPAIRRKRLHRQIGEALATMPDAHPDTVAYHFRVAGDARAAGWLVQAGGRAFASYAYATAEARFGQALPRLAGVERAIVLFYLSFLHRTDAGSIPEAEEAMRIATEAGERALEALSRVRLGATLAYLGEIGRGIAEITAGSAVLDALPDTAMERLAHLGRAANFLSPAGRRAMLMTPYALGGWNAETIAMLGCTVDDALNQLNTLHVNAKLSVGFVCSALGRAQDARIAWTSSRAGWHALEDWASYAIFSGHLLNQVHLPYFADDLVERECLVVEMERALGRHAAQGGASPPAQVFWQLLGLEGRWAEARKRWAGSTESATIRIYAAPQIGGLARAQGEREMTWRLVREALPDGPATEPGGTIFMPMTEMQRLAASLALDDGDLPTAKAWLDAHDRWLAWSGAVRGQAEGHLGWADYHRAAGDTVQAHECAERALAHATEPRQPLALLAAHRLLGELDTGAGRFADAQSHLDASLALADACAAPYERALTLLAMAELRAATGKRDASRTLLDEVRAICEPLGAKPALARADTLTAHFS